MCIQVHSKVLSKPKLLKWMVVSTVQLTWRTIFPCCQSLFSFPMSDSIACGSPYSMQFVETTFARNTFEHRKSGIKTDERITRRPRSNLRLRFSWKNLFFPLQEQQRGSLVSGRTDNAALDVIFALVWAIVSSSHPSHQIPSGS
jgi:hypothetical protein